MRCTYPILAFGGVFILGIMNLYADIVEPVQIVVSGKKFSESVEESSVRVDVITEAQIRESGAKNIAEALQHIPGISFTGHPIQSIMIQGLSGSYVKFMIDGIEVTGDIGGSTPAYQIPVSSIERIEIVHGASSALFGSDAMGGVINIITKKTGPQANIFSLDLTQEFASNFRTYSSVRTTLSRIDFALSMSGSFDYDEGRSFASDSGHAVFNVPFNRLGSGRLTADWFNKEGKLGIFTSYRNSLLKANANDSYRYSYESNKISGGITGERRVGDLVSLSGFLSGTFDALRNRNRDYATDIRGGTDTIFTDGESEVRVEYTPNISHTLVVGLNGRYESIKGDAFDALESMLLLSAFAQNSWNIRGLDRFTVTIGGRIDFSPKLNENDPILFQATPKISLRAAPTTDTIIRASYGMGYKVPSLKHQFWVFYHAAGGGFYILGNPDLKPEYSHGINLSLDQKIGGAVKVFIAGYYNLVNNLITTQMNAENSNYSYQNVNSSETYGLSTGLQFTQGNFDGALSYVYTGARTYNDLLNRYLDLTGRVPHAVAVKASYEFPGVGVKIFSSAAWDSPQLIESVNEYTTPDKLMVKVGVEKKFGEHLDLYLRGDNVLNNFHLIKGKGGINDGQDQKDYFHLHDGFILTIGGRLKL